MELHKNARTCPHSRALIVQRVDSGESAANVALDLGISERTIYKWRARFRDEGAVGLQDRPSRPRSSPRRTPNTTVRQILALRRQRRVSAEIAHLIGHSPSTVARIVKRHGLGLLTKLDPPEPPRRYEKPFPGHLLHIDIKKLGRINGNGHRITGDRSKRNRGIGWEFTHVCVDDHSRLTYAEVLDSETQEDAVAFLKRAMRFYQGHGIQVRAVMTDNGSCYISNRFRQCLARHNVRHIRTRPYRPRTNGKAERFIQTALREWAYRFAYTSSAQRTYWLSRWLHFYNHHRMHQSLKNLPPISRIPLNNVLTIHS